MQNLDTGYIVLIIVATILITATVVYLLTSRSKINNESIPRPQNQNSNTLQMQLQAYERLLLLVDRIALPNLISRINQPQASANEMHLLLTQNIRAEFDYNITQQAYVSTEAWTAVKNLKEQNLLIINQMAKVLPPAAIASDLNKLLLEYLMNDKKGALHEVVSEVLSYEAKKLI